MDWFSRYVLAWELDCILEVDFVLEALNKALQVEKPEIVNSDQGSLLEVRSSKFEKWPG
jgi:putative transposase